MAMLSSAGHVPPCISIEHGGLRSWRLHRQREAIEVTTFGDVAPVYIDGPPTATLEIEVIAHGDYPSVDVTRAWLVEERIEAEVNALLCVRQTWRFEEMPDIELNALIGLPSAKKVEAPEVIRRKIRAMDLG